MTCSSCGKKQDRDMGESPTFGSQAIMEMSQRRLGAEGPYTEALADQSGMIESIKYIHGLHQVNPKTKRHLQRLQRG
jgi:hypothetical protein